MSCTVRFRVGVLDVVLKTRPFFNSSPSVSEQSLYETGSGSLVHEETRTVVRTGPTVHEVFHEVETRTGRSRLRLAELLL